MAGRARNSSIRPTAAMTYMMAWKTPSAATCAARDSSAAVCTPDNRWCHCRI
ncbi:hypothetical protein D3C81_2070860 [compost metagenome]